MNYKKRKNNIKMIGFLWVKRESRVSSIYRERRTLWRISFADDLIVSWGKDTEARDLWLIILAVGLNSVKGRQTRDDQVVAGQPSPVFIFFSLSLFFLPSFFLVGYTSSFCLSFHSNAFLRTFREYEIFIGAREIFSLTDFLSKLN